MLMDYHQMTMNEPRDSPARKKQYLVICCVMAGVFVYTLLTSGALSSVPITVQTFPGGTFIYKNSTRDYAAAAGLCEELGNVHKLSKHKFKDFMYTLYLDHPYQIGGGDQRMATGLLFSTPEQKQTYASILQQAKKKKTKDVVDADDMSKLEVFQQQDYQIMELPSMEKASVAQFPHTNGFVSALLVSYKILPALIQHATTTTTKEETMTEKKKEKVVPPVVVLATCDPPNSMCTFYAPHNHPNQKKKYLNFWLNQDDASTYQTYLASQSSSSFWGGSGLVDWKGVQKDFFMVVTLPYQWIFGGDSSSNDKKKKKEEL